MVVYTAVFGDYDEVQPPVDPGDARWVCITDGADAPKPWHTARVPAGGHLWKRARLWKIRSHRWFREGVTVWLDGNIRLKAAPETLLKYIERADIAALEHDRADHYAEADICLDMGKGDPEQIKRQVRAYKLAGCGPQPVYATGLMVRRHTPAVVALNELWWQQIERYSVRDQISLSYCLWKLGMPITAIPGPWMGGPEHWWVEHD